VPLSIRSPNFGFLAGHDERLAVLGAQAERYFGEAPNLALTALRLFGEILAKRAAANAGLYVSERDDQAHLVGGFR
jgi:type I restriction enzyme, R subunit